MTGLTVILLLALAVYAPTVAHPFHFDDYAILGDPALTSPDGWRQVFRPDQTRPLTYLTFWLNYRLGRDSPAGYHAANVLLHLAAAAAARVAFRRIAGPAPAVAATAIFALHPLQSEAVCYIFARAIILAAFLCLLSWRAWLDGRPWMAAGWFCLALLAKEEVIAFPLFLWLVARDRPRRWPPLAAMLAASAAAGFRLLWVAAHTSGSGLTPSPSARYLFLQPVAMVTYLRLFLWPAGQNFDHDLRAPSVFAVVILLGLVAAAAFRRERWIPGALLLLAPTSSIIPLADPIYEHRMYLPVAALALAAAPWVVRLPRPAQGALLIAFTAATFFRVRVWSSEESLWADAAAKSPGKFRPRVQLARALFSREPERAEALLLEARRIEPRNPESYTQMGALMLEQRNPYGALGEFDEALRLAPSADAWSNRGTALFLLSRRGEAEDAFRRALALNPCHYNALHNLRLLTGARPPLPPACRFTPDQFADLESARAK